MASRKSIRGKPMTTIAADRNAALGEVVYIGTDQPETCRFCGSRTDFEELPNEQQLHQCLDCGKRYIVEFDESFEC